LRGRFADRGQALRRAMIAGAPRSVVQQRAFFFAIPPDTMDNHADRDGRPSTCIGLEDHFWRWNLPHRPLLGPCPRPLAEPAGGHAPGYPGAGRKRRPWRGTRPEAPECPWKRRGSVGKPDPCMSARNAAQATPEAPLAIRVNHFFGQSLGLFLDPRIGENTRLKAHGKPAGRAGRRGPSPHRDGLA
jgi:hypothetical protein